MLALMSRYKSSSETGRRQTGDRAAAHQVINELVALGELHFEPRLPPCHVQERHNQLTSRIAVLKRRRRTAQRAGDQELARQITLRIEQLTR